MDGTRDSDVLVVGGGVIGLACGIALLEAGRRVRVLEAGTAGCGSSHGNCGTLTPSHALPLAAPGTLGRALRWMFRPDAPLYLRPRFDPALWAWLARFASRCNGRDWRRNGAAKAALLARSRKAFPDWLSRHRIDCSFEAAGGDHVFRDPAGLEAFAAECAVLADLGIASETIDGADYLRAEPALREGVAGVVRFPGDASLRPDAYVAGLARAFRAAGGELVERMPVRDIVREGEAWRVVCEAAHGQAGAASAVDRAPGAAARFRARDVLLAAGAWSPRIAARFSRRLPLLARAMQPGKGYSQTWDRPSRVPSRPLVLQERSICVTAWADGFRLGSTMEFSGYDASLNRRRLDALARGAADYLREPTGPALREEWFGWRPMTVDDLPILGPAPGAPGLWLATGHGMLGVSMSTGTAELMADLVLGRAPAIDPAPYAPVRFA